MKGVKYLTFEINQDCNLTSIRERCPINDPQRYMFGRREQTMTDAFVMEFWLWCRDKGFDGTVLWHLYNEPTLALDRINELTAKMRAVAPSQAFHLWTNGTRLITREELFRHVQVTNYHNVRPDELDNRRASTKGEGRFTHERGVCGRGYGWEIIIDNFGNWLLCCNDWRCEESAGNVFEQPWGEVFANYQQKANIAWDGEESWKVLPRMCRSCMDVNPGLHLSATMVGFGG